MAVQAVDIKSGEKTEVPADSTNGTSPPSIQQKARVVTEKAIGVAERYGSAAAQKSQSLVDSAFPPEKREMVMEKARAFASARPKLSAFLAINLLFTAVPLLLFLIFSISTFVVSLLVAVTTALLVAGTFTLFAVGAAFLVFLPVVLFTTFVASSLFIWGLVLFLIYNWATREPSSQILDNRANGRNA